MAVIMPAGKRKSASARAARKRKKSPRQRGNTAWKVLVWSVGLLSAYALLASLFFLFSWEKDLVLVAGLSWSDFQQAHPDMAANPFGMVGAWLAYWLTYRGFGIAGLVIPFWGIWLLLKRIKKSIPWGPVLQGGLMVLLFLPPLLSFFFNESYPLAGGLVGYQLQWWLRGVLGTPGFVMVMGGVFLAYGAWRYGTWFSRLWEKVARRWRRLFPQQEKKTPLSENPPEASPTEEAVEETSEEWESPAVTTDERPSDSKAPDPSPGEVTAPESDDTPSEDAIPMEVVGTPAPSGDDPEETPRVVTEPYDETAELPNYQFPTLDLLHDYPAPDPEKVKKDLEEGKARIVQTLRHYGIEIDRIRATVGPTVTLYEIVPRSGVRVKKIQNLEDDIALSLAAEGIRIIAPMPGRGTIGIEVPNPTPQIVGLKGLLASEAFRNSTAQLPLALGRTIDNRPFIVDLAKMPHLLIAGATGQGKSVGINVIIASLLFKKHPAQVKFVLVDPKKVELNLYDGMANHFLAHLPNCEEPILTETEDVLGALNSLTQIMDHRYALLKAVKARSIKEYNKKFIARKLNPDEGHHYMPYIVLVVDEFADLIMRAGKEVEQPIARLAQLARAVGIHLILATQRPSVNIITGVIKANFPVRIAFRVSSKVDSRTIIDANGAERLIGRGDMLYFDGSMPTRLQCAFIDTDEVEQVVDFIGQQPGFHRPFALPDPVLDDDDEAAAVMDGDWDALLPEVARFVVSGQQVSASLIQRRYKVGYNRAARIVEQLEQLQIVSAPGHNSRREVLITDNRRLEQLLQNHNLF